MEEKKEWKGFGWRVKVREVGEIVKCQVLELKIKDKVDLEYRGTVVSRYPGNTGFRTPVPYLSRHMSSQSFRGNGDHVCYAFSCRLSIISTLIIIPSTV